MIKYTGYGNAAGMFANKGLLGPEHAKVDYSSESEDSETEEYEKYKEQYDKQNLYKFYKNSKFIMNF